MSSNCCDLSCNVTQFQAQKDEAKNKLSKQEARVAPKLVHSTSSRGASKWWKSAKGVCHKADRVEEGGTQIDIIPRSRWTMFREVVGNNFYTARDGSCLRNDHDLNLELIIVPSPMGECVCVWSFTLLMGRLAPIDRNVVTRNDRKLRHGTSVY